MHLKNGKSLKFTSNMCIKLDPPQNRSFTLPETNIAPENGWLEY